MNKQTQKQERKRILQNLLIIFFVNIILAIAFFGLQVVYYLSAFQVKTIFYLTIATDVFQILSLSNFAFMLKFKSNSLFVITVLALVVSMVLRITVVSLTIQNNKTNVLRYSIQAGILILEIIQICIILYVKSVWSKIPENKWLNKFDLERKLTSEVTISRNIDSQKTIGSK